MPKLVLSFALVLATLFALPITPAQALNDQSWVASYGSDSNSCTRASPCASFSQAVSQTNAGGEVNCVDQGDFFSSLQLTITKSMTIDCEGVEGRMSNTSVSTLIIVQAGASDSVTLRGLDLTGRGGAVAGVGLASGAALHIDKCVIHDFTLGVARGITAVPLATGSYEIFISDTVLANNGGSSTGGGIWVVPSAPNAIVRVTMNRVEARNNFFGIKADGTGATGGVINMTVRDSVSSGNHSNGIVATGNASGPAIIMMVEHSTSSQNATAGFGIIADGPKSTIVLTGSTVMGNINGIGASNGGSLVSFQDNKVILNSTNGTLTSVASPE